jgi:hypothetical protein
LDEDLTAAVQRALHIPPALCRAHAARFSWTAVAQSFVRNLAVIDGAGAPC